MLSTFSITATGFVESTFNSFVEFGVWHDNNIIKNGGTTTKIFFILNDAIKKPCLRVLNLYSTSSHSSTTDIRYTP